MDIAYRAVRQQGSTVGLSSRHGFLSVPAIMDNGKPLDIFISNLFEHSHEHPWVHAWQLKWKLSTWVIRGGMLLATGSSWGWNQWYVHALPTARPLPAEIFAFVRCCQMILRANPAQISKEIPVPCA